MTTAPDTEAQDLSSDQPTGGDDGDDGLGTQAEVESLGSCKLKVKAQVAADKVTELLNKNYRDLISSLELPGFRRGRVPRSLVEKRYGEDIKKDLQEALLNDSFLEVVEQNDLKVVGRPKFDGIKFEDDEPFSYEAVVEIRPEFELKKYKGLEVERSKETVEQEEIDKEIDRIRERHASLVPIDRKDAGADDWYFGSYKLISGSDGEEIQADNELAFKPSEKHMHGFPVEDLEDRVKGLGDEKVLRIENVDLPDGAPEEWNEGGVTFEATIEDTKKLELPEVNDEFAKQLNLESVEKLQQEVRESLDSRNDYVADQKVEEKLIEAIESELDFEQPEVLIDDQKQAHKIRLQYQLIQMGKSKEEIEEEVNKAGSIADDDIRKEIKRHFILDAIAEKEKVFATEDDVQARILALAQAYNRKPEEVIGELQQGGRLEELRVDIRHGKVKRLLREKAKVTGDASNGKGDDKKKAKKAEPETSEKSDEGTSQE